VCVWSPAIAGRGSSLCVLGLVPSHYPRGALLWLAAASVKAQTRGVASPSLIRPVTVHCVRAERCETQ